MIKGRLARVAVGVAVLALVISACSEKHRADYPKAAATTTTKPQIPPKGKPTTTLAPPPTRPGAVQVPPTPTVKPRSFTPSPKARSLVNGSPTNLISNFDVNVCNTTNMTLSGLTPAVYDASVTHGTCGSVQLPWAGSCPITGDPLANPQSGLQANGRCPYTDGSRMLTPALTVTPGARYTFSFFQRSEAEPRGDVYVDLDVLDTGGTTYNYTMMSTHGINTKINGGPANDGWEEQTVQFIAPSSGKIRFDLYRYFPNSAPITKIWVDDFVLNTGWSTRTTPITPKRGFNGVWTKIDELGNFQQKLNDGLYHDYFPICIQPASGGNVAGFYASKGLNCFWATATDNFGQPWDSASVAASTPYVWNGSTYVLQNWTHSSTNTFNPLSRAENETDAEFAPEGFTYGLDINSAVRGSYINGKHQWSSADVIRLKNALLNINGNGWDRRLGFMMLDAEDDRDKLQRLQAVLKLVRACDSTTLSGTYAPGQICSGGSQRRHPIISNVGLPGSQGQTRDPATGASLDDAIGVYSGNPGPFQQLNQDPNIDIPGNYCQIQSGLGWGLKAAIYNCLGEGGKMISLWADNGGCYAYASCPIDQLHQTYWPDTSPQVPDAQVGYPYEPMFYSGVAKTNPDAAPTMTYTVEFKRTVREINQLMPLLKTGTATWTATSSNANVFVFPRTYNNEAYLFVVNQSQSAQSTTVSVSGVGGTLTNATNYFGGATVAAFSGSNVTLNVPALGQSTAVGDVAAGGTMVLKLAGSSITTTTTTPGATTTSTTTTLPPTTTTALPTAPTDDDAGDGWTYTGSWTAYSPATVYNDADYNKTVHESNSLNAKASRTFSGIGIDVRGVRGRYSGIATIKLDGSTVATVDLYQLPAGNGVIDTRDVSIWSASGLSPTTHTVEVIVTATNNQNALGAFIAIDRSIITPIPSTTDMVYLNTLPTPPNTIALGSAYAVVSAQRVNFTCSGTINGVWWYRTADDTGTQTVSVWNTSGTLLGSGTGTPTTVGWTYIALGAPVSVTSGAQLVVGVHHPNGAYGYSLNGLNGRSVTSPSNCMTIPASSANNGLYVYSTASAFPTLSYQSSEYFLSPDLVVPAPTTTTTTTTTTSTTTTSTTTTTAPGATTTTAAPTTTTSSTTTTVAPNCSLQSSQGLTATWSGGANPSYTTDRNLGTYWVGTSTKPQIISWDLGSNKTITRAQIQWLAGRAADSFAIETRTATGSYSLRWIQSGYRSATTSCWNSNVLAGFSARYVRVTLLSYEPGASAGPIIKEFSIT